MYMITSRVCCGFLKILIFLVVVFLSFIYLFFCEMPQYSLKLLCDRVFQYAVKVLSFSIQSEKTFQVIA